MTSAEGSEEGEARMVCFVAVMNPWLLSGWPVQAEEGFCAWSGCSKHW